MAMVALVASAVVASLTGCGSGSSHGRYFAYVEYEPGTTAGVKPAAHAAHHQPHAGAKHAAGIAPRAAGAHGSWPAKTTVTGNTPYPGPYDIWIYDTHRNKAEDVTGGGSTDEGLYVESVQVSNGGTRLVASVYTCPSGDPTCASNDGNYQLWVGDKNVHSITQITFDAVDHYDATFSADGRTITYYAYDSTAELYQLFTVTAASPYTQTEVPTAAYDAYSPVFTPDGKNLVFECDSVDTGTEVICTTGLPGTANAGTVTLLSQPSSNSVTEIYEYDFYPSVSPDGKQISFTRETDNNVAETSTEDIFVMPIAGEPTPDSATGLTTGNLVTAGTSFQPMYLDNSKENIVYLSFATDVLDVYEMNKDGSTTGLSHTQLTDTVDEDYFKGGD